MEQLGKFIEKHLGKLAQQSLRPLEGNGMASILKIDANNILKRRISCVKLKYFFSGQLDTNALKKRKLQQKMAFRSI